MRLHLRWPEWPDASGHVVALTLEPSPSAVVACGTSDRQYGRRQRWPFEGEIILTDRMSFVALFLPLTAGHATGLGPVAEVTLPFRPNLRDPGRRVMAVLVLIELFVCLWLKIPRPGRGHLRACSPLEDSPKRILGDGTLLTFRLPRT